MKSVYTDPVEEYRTLRGGTGLIDYEGAGLLRVGGPGAGAFLGRTFTRNVDFLLEGQISSVLALRPDGTVVAESAIYCEGGDYLVETWPAQAQECRDHVLAAAEDAGEEVGVRDLAGELAVFGIEGPQSFKIAERFLPFPVASMAFRSFVTAEHEGTPITLSRTGVTGEYGYKLLVPQDKAAAVRAELLELGAQETGLEAVDICRMEMRFANLERESGGRPFTPFDLGLQWMCDFQNDFTGRDALLAGERDRLPVCWQGTGDGAPPEHGTSLCISGTEVGQVSHAVRSPALDHVIGTARVDRDFAASGLEYELDGRTVRTVSAPFHVATSFDVPMD